jgi:ribosome-associated protein
MLRCVSQKAYNCISKNLAAAIAMSKVIEFQLLGEFIALDALLKTTGIATSGGEAKAMVAAGKVHVDGELELRKRCKIRLGQVVSVGGSSIHVVARV